MNTKQDLTIASGEHLTLPEPDPDNITVLTRNLPNKPILPWNHYDSPWQEAQEEDAIASETANQADEPNDNTEDAAPESVEAQNLDEKESADQVDELDDHQLVAVTEQQFQPTLEELHQLG
ncbi:MAG: hypothetical protein ICV85_10095 [Tolypothrix sp. T3-bin4]|nr:hypothetical protein [Tolypothrix sp. T3-bin4]